MRHYAIRRAARCLVPLSIVLLTLSVLLTASVAFTAVVGDQVELNATHQGGVPFHNKRVGIS
jgi:hypothetical protein